MLFFLTCIVYYHLVEYIKLFGKNGMIQSNSTHKMLLNGIDNYISKNQDIYISFKILQMWLSLPVSI